MTAQAKSSKTENNDEVSRRISYLERLRNITHLVHSSENLDEILINLKGSILTLLDADRISIYAVDKVKRELFTKVMVGNGLKEIRVPIKKSSIAGYVAVTGQLVSITNVYDDDELKAIHPELKFDRSWDKKGGYKTKQILTGPLIHEKYLVGVIQVINKKSGNNFKPEDVSSVKEISEVLALAFYNHNRRSTQYKSKFDYLLHQNIISDEDFKKAMVEARERKWDLANVLIKVNKIAKDQIGRSLSAYYKLKFIGYDGKYTPPIDLLDRLSRKNPFKFMQYNCWVPYKEENGKLVVVCEDPSDQNKISDIKLLVKSELELAVGLRDDIVQLIGKLSGSSVASLGGIDDALADMKVEDSEATEKELQEEGTTISENDSGIVKLVNQVIVDAYKKGVSDIHIETYPGKQNTLIRFRRDGICFVYKEIPANWKKALVARIKIISNLNIAERRLPQDGKIQIKYGGEIIELRVAVVPTTGGNEDVVMRILAASEPIPLDKLNLSPRNIDFFTKAVANPYGIFLVVGPTGSGKTTTLHSALGHINTIERKIWTAEDPIEITQHGLRQVQMQPAIDLTFATALRAFLRADPDVIMIGEMRDQETANMGVEASLTGHLVFSTLHTNSAPETITRLIDLGVDPFNFADALLGILAQRLVRTLCKKCKTSHTASQEELDILAKEYGESYWPELNVTMKSAKMSKPKGCDNCNNKGYSGRTGLHEIMVTDEETKRLIQTKALVDDIRKSAIKHGMRTLKQDGIWKVSKGDTEIEKVRSVCSV